MYCVECGAEVEDGSRFCTSCGAELEAIDNDDKDLPVDDDQDDKDLPVDDDQDDKDLPVDDDQDEEDLPVDDDQDEKKNDPGEHVDWVKPRKNGILKKAIPVVVLAAVILIAAVSIPRLFSEKVPVVYLSGNKYEVIKSLNGAKSEGTEIAKAKIDETLEDYNYNSLVKFSQNGKYVYYMTKFNDSDDTGTLNRVEYAKLKDGSSKNDKYIDTIDTNVQTGFVVVDDDKLVYQTGANDLYYYDGKEAELIKREVDLFLADEKGNIVYGIDNSDDDSYCLKLYGVNIKDITKEEELVEKCYNILGMAKDSISLDDFLALESNNDDTYTVYKTGVGKETEKIADSVLNYYYSYAVNDNCVYFTTDTGESLSLYDYVNDGYAQSDASIKEPQKADYAIPSYSYRLIYSSDYTENDFPALYTSIENDIYWYGQSWYSNYSMNEAVNMEWGDNTDAIVTATRNFISKYASSADSDGYILVTDEVKSDLKKINSANPNRSAEDWIKFCLYKEQTGTTYDYDKYNAEYEKYNQAINRIELRQDLKDRKYKYKVKNLYCYEDGEVTTVAENVCGVKEVSSYNGGKTILCYNTKDKLDLSVNIDEISYVSDVTDRIESFEAEMNIVVNGKTYSFAEGSLAALQEYCEDADIDSIYCTENMMFASGDGTIIGAKVKDTVIGDWDIITDDGTVLMTDDTALYYAEGAYTDDYKYFADVCKYEKGESACVAKDVVNYSGNVYSDNTILAYTDYESSYGYELTMFDKNGDKTVIADSVTAYSRMDSSTILYIEDDDLYVYDGEESAKIAGDVSYFWTNESMESKPLNLDD